MKLHLIPKVVLTSSNELATLLPEDCTMVFVAAGDISVTSCHVLLSLKEVSDTTIDAEHMRTAGIFACGYQDGGKPFVWSGRINIGRSTVRKLHAQFSGLSGTDQLFMTVGYETQ